MKAKEKIRKHIQNSNTEEAIKILLRCTAPNQRLHDKALIISSRFEMYRTDKYIIGNGKEEVLISIQNAILELIKEEVFPINEPHDKPLEQDEEIDMISGKSDSSTITQVKTDTVEIELYN